MAVSWWFSTCTVISYFPEWLRSALRMKMMLSQSVLRMLMWVASMGLPSFSQLTFGLGLPCRHHTHTESIIMLRDTAIIDQLGGCCTINGTTRLTASPTLRVYVCFKCRGTRILGGSEEETDHKVSILSFSFKTTTFMPSSREVHAQKISAAVFRAHQ